MGNRRTTHKPSQLESGEIHSNHGCTRIGTMPTSRHFPLPGLRWTWTNQSVRQTGRYHLNIVAQPFWLRVRCGILDARLPHGEQGRSRNQQAGSLRYTLQIRRVTNKKGRPNGLPRYVLKVGCDCASAVQRLFRRSITMPSPATATRLSVAGSGTEMVIWSICAMPVPVLDKRIPR